MTTLHVISCTVSEEEERQIKLWAQDEHMTVSAIVRGLLQEALRERGELVERLAGWQPE